MAPRSQRREQTRQRIVEAAIEVVGRRGFEAASVNEIAATAGFSIGALYGNFAGKEELFLAVYDAHAEWFESMLAELDVGGDATTVVQDAFARFDDAREQLLVFVDFWGYAVRDPALRSALAERMAALRSALAARLEERAEALGRPLPLGADTAAVLLLAVWRGLALEWFADPDAVPREELAAVLAAVVG